MSGAKFADLFRIKHGFAFKSEFFDTGGEYVLLTPGNFHEEGGFRDVGESQKHYNGAVPEGFILDEGDLLVAMTEQAEGLLGSSARMPSSGKYLHNQRLGRVVDLKEDFLDKRYLYYLFNTRFVRHQISASATGTKVRHTAPERIGRIEVRLPAVAVQRRVAEVLSAYDDLIENNRRRMALLEEAALLLYHEWFVRLRFPGHKLVETTDSAIGRIPANWGLTTLGNITTKIGSGATPRGGEAAYESEGIALIRSQNVYNDRFEDDGLAYINDSQADDLANVSVEPRDILLNITGASVARCCMVPKRHLPARVNQHVMIIRSDPALADPYFVLASINSEGRKRQLISYARAGGTREALTKDIIASFQIVMPEKRIWKRFGKIVGEIYQQLDLLGNQNAALRSARNLLLPRLMTGEIVPR